MKRVMALKEHHDTVMLDVTTDEQLHAVCLQVVTARFSTPELQEWMNDTSPPDEPSLGRALSESLPSGSVRAAALYEWEQYDKRVQAIEQKKKDIADIRKAIETRDGRLAYKVMYRRRWVEDESFDIVKVFDQYPPPIIG